MAQVIMMGMFITSVIGTLWYSGKDTLIDSQNIRNQVKQINQQTGIIKDNIQQINQKNLVIDVNIKNDITNAIKTQQTLSAELIIANNNYAAKLKIIQVYGIIFIGIIGILLLIKKTNILTYLFK